MRFASAFSFVLAAVAAVPAMAWRSAYLLWAWHTDSILTCINRSSFQERSVDVYGEPLAARGWSDVATRSVDWDEGLVARDDYYTRSYDDSELYARASYDAYADARMQRREDARVLARELVNILYARTSECRVVLCLVRCLTVPWIR